MRVTVPRWIVSGVKQEKLSVIGSTTLTRKMGQVGDAFVHSELGARGTVLSSFETKTRIYDPGLEEYIFEIDGKTFLSALDSRDLGSVHPSPLLHSFLGIVKSFFINSIFYIIQHHRFSINSSPYLAIPKLSYRAKRR